MFRLLRLVHLPFWEKHPTQALLPALGIALGVAAIIAIDLGSGSTVSSFRRTVERLEGRATHQVLPGREGLRGELAVELSYLPGVEAAAPVLETFVLAQEPLRLYGIDPLSEAGVRDLGLELDDTELDVEEATQRFFGLMAEPGALLISEDFLERHDLEAGDRLDVAVGSFQREAFVLGALPDEIDGLEVPDNFALADLATAQELTGRDDVTRIDLVVDDEDRRETLADVRAVLPVGARIEEPGGSARYLETMLSALRMNLGALSYLALFVSLFLIYNALLLAVLRRRPHLGVVRCLGATRREVLGAWLIEAALIAAIGTVLGILLGIGAGRFALEGISQTASDLYGYVRADTLELVPSTLIKAVVVGVLATLVAALWPASEAASTPPAHTASRGDVEATTRRRLYRMPWLAVPLGLIAVAGLLWPSTSPLPGYVAAIGLALGAAVIVPLLGSIVLERLQPVLARVGGEVAALAARNIRASLSRTGVALAALTVALSMSIAMGTMVASFHAELKDWIADSVRADVYIGPATAEVDRLQARLDPALVALLRHREGVEAVDTYRGLMAEVEGTQTFTAGVDIDVFRRGAEPTLIAGPNVDVFLDRIESGQAGISETLMRRTELRPGDTFEMEVRGQTEELTVAGVYRDYSSDRGVVLLDQRTWRLTFGDHDPNSVALYLEEGVDTDAFIDELKLDLADTWAVEINSNESLRRQADEVFARTFSVADALEVIGIAVAAIGILAALLAMLMERRRELATLRALGLTRRQLRNLLLGESVLLATLAWLFALLCGSGLAWILLRVINLRSFGWMLPFHVPWGEWMLNLGWSLLAAGLATLIPIVRGRKMSVAASLREE
jgi:putative ABC transport system permease protein